MLSKPRRIKHCLGMFTPKQKFKSRYRRKVGHNKYQQDVLKPRSHNSETGRQFECDKTMEKYKMYLITLIYI